MNKITSIPVIPAFVEGVPVNAIDNRVGLTDGQIPNRRLSPKN